MEESTPPTEGEEPKPASSDEIEQKVWSIIQGVPGLNVGYGTARLIVYVSKGNKQQAWKSAIGIAKGLVQSAAIVGSVFVAPLVAVVAAGTLTTVVTESIQGAAHVLIFVVENSDQFKKNPALENEKLLHDGITDAPTVGALYNGIRAPVYALKGDAHEAKVSGIEAVSGSAQSAINTGINIIPGLDLESRTFLQCILQSVVQLVSKKVVDDEKAGNVKEKKKDCEDEKSSDVSPTDNADEVDIVVIETESSVKDQINVSIKDEQIRNEGSQELPIPEDQDHEAKDPSKGLEMKSRFSKLGKMFRRNNNKNENSLPPSETEIEEQSVEIQNNTLIVTSDDSGISVSSSDPSIISEVNENAVALETEQHVDKSTTFKNKMKKVTGILRFHNSPGKSTGTPSPTLEDSTGALETDLDGNSDDTEGNNDNSKKVENEDNFKDTLKKIAKKLKLQSETAATSAATLSDSEQDHLLQSTTNNIVETPTTEESAEGQEKGEQQRKQDGKTKQIFWKVLSIKKRQHTSESPAISTENLEEVESKPTIESNVIVLDYETERDNDASCNSDNGGDTDKLRNTLKKILRVMKLQGDNGLKSGSQGSLQGSTDSLDNTDDNKDAKNKDIVLIIS